ncbi:molybdopterin converting factor subunit 1 [Paenibacillus sp. TRM 82003]|nr:molybdopterin converting factor subunit 1 [Paenibacillus sp. TRM 82003]
MLNVLVFAGLAETVGAPSVALDGVDAPLKVSELKAAVAARYPAAADQLAACFAAINQSFADDEAVVKPGDEVALLPPVSGG